MAVDFESSDILGSPLPLGKGRVAKATSFSSFFKLCLIGAAALLGLLLIQYGRAAFLRWRERHYKLSMRRKYGIPDHDQRPFNVAYTAARRAQEDSRRQKDRPLVQGEAMATGRDVRGQKDYAPSFPSTQPPHRPTQPPMQPFPLQHRQGSIVPSTSAPSTSASRLQLQPSYSSNLATTGGQSPSPRPSSYGVGAEWRSPEIQAAARVQSRQSPLERAPSAPVVGDGDRYSEQRVAQDVAPRKPKRLADSGEDGDLESNEGRYPDKRRRKVSSSITMDVDESIADEDMEVERVSEMKLQGRGKKRDRAEAASTSGGDDEALTDEQDEDRAHRHRRRRHRKLSLQVRGQKRTRDMESVESIESEDDHRRSRRKMSQRIVESAESDESLEDAQFSKDPLCKGRRIGEEWEAHGVQFKVGRNGERLRKVLVKEDRRKFNMPVDSAHPDRGVSVTVIAERWYTDEAYRRAKEQRELAWQDDTKAFAQPETPGDDSFYQDHNGKELLWKSPSTRGRPAPRRGPLGQSVATNVGLRITSLAQPQQPKRVGSLLKIAEMSPKPKPSKTYSRLEKQDLEADAMLRIRRKAEEEKAKKEAEAKKALPPPPAPKAPSVTAPSLFAPPKPSEKPAEPSVPSISFPKPSEAPKGAEKAAAPEPAKPAFGFPAPTGAGLDKTKAGEKAPPPFSFAPPSAPKAVTPAAAPIAPAAPGGGVPDFFGVKAAAGDQAAKAPAPGAAAPPTITPVATEKPAFSFAPPAATGKPAFSFGQPTPSAQPTAAAVAPPAPGGLFGKPTEPTTAAPTSVFGKPAEPSKAPAAAPAGAAAAKPKFDFGLAPKAPGIAAAPAAAAPSFSFGAAKEPSAPPAAPAPSFSFGAAKDTAPTAPSTPSFSFGAGKEKDSPMSTEKEKAPAVASPFGTTQGTGGPFAFGSPMDASKQAPAPAAPSAFGAPTSQPSPFGPTDSAKPAFGGGFGSPSPFASKPADSSAAGTSPFGTSAFGGGAAPKPAEQASSFFSFKPTEAPASVSSLTGRQSRSSSPASTRRGPRSVQASRSSGARGSSTIGGKTPTTESPTSFTFNAAGKSSQPSPGFSFSGAPSQPSGSSVPFSFSFGSGQGTTDATKPSSPFGSPAPSPSTGPGAGGFGFGFGSAPATNTSGLTFGQQNGTANPAANNANPSPFGAQGATPSAFGFGAGAPSSGSSSFTFGSQQK